MENIFWYIFYGILSTFLVHPWYIKGLLKGKTIFRDYKSYYGFSFSQKVLLYIGTIFGIIVLFLSMNSLYIKGDVLMPPYTPHLIIIFIFLFQSINYLIISRNIDSSKFFNGYLLIFLYIIILSFINFNSFPFRDNKIIENIPNLLEYKNTENISVFIPTNDITTEYEKDNLKYLFKNDSNCSSITILNSKNSTYSVINLNENLLSDTTAIREVYPNFMIKYIGITITKDNKVYKTYALFDINAFCYTPTFTKFVLKDCNSSNILTIE